MRNAVVFPNSKCKLVHLCNRNFLLLDVSHRDDLRMFCAWKASGGLGAAVIEKWAWSGGTLVLHPRMPTLGLRIAMMSLIIFRSSRGVHGHRVSSSTLASMACLFGRCLCLLCFEHGSLGL